MGVKVSGTLKLLPLVTVAGKVSGLVREKGPETLTEPIVPLALPVLVASTIKLLVLPTFAPVKVIVPPGATVVADPCTRYL